MLPQRIPRQDGRVNGRFDREMANAGPNECFDQAAATKGFADVSGD